MITFKDKKEKKKICEAMQMMNVECVTSVNQEHKELLPHNISGVTYSTLINNLNMNPILPAKTAFGTPVKVLPW